MKNDLFKTVSPRDDTVRTCVIWFIKKIPHWIAKHTHSTTDFKSSDQDITRKVINSSIESTKSLLDYLLIEWKHVSIQPYSFASLYFSKEKLQLIDSGKKNSEIDQMLEKRKANSLNKWKELCQENKLARLLGLLAKALLD